jgi:hypothetical protein
VSAAEVHGLVDRAGWPSGPWDGEPDRVEFKASGFPCLILRVTHHGALCGYVAVPPGHPAHGKKWSSYENSDIEAPGVHGGVTFTEGCQGEGPLSVCHVPAAGEPDDVWWIGFDTVHAGDFAPAMDGARRGRVPDFEYAAYRDIWYVRREVERLAAQLAEMGSAS